jgi:acetophenone carboxylase
MLTRDITEYISVNLETEQWECGTCEEPLGDAHEPYKRGCLVRERDPHEVHTRFTDHDEYNFAPHPDWVRILEFFCPNCGTMVEVEYLPPGHPITDDITLDIAAMKERAAAERAESP